jgi:hypothetical protein
VSPELYRQEQKQERVRARFKEAIQFAEQAFLDDFAKLVNHLTERISGTNDDGTPKIFRDSAIDNLCEFFERIRSLNVRGNQQLDELVVQAQRAVRGVAAQDLRDGQAVRQEVASQLATVQTTLDSILIERPRRRILRTASKGGRTDGSGRLARWHRTRHVR